MADNLISPDGIPLTGKIETGTKLQDAITASPNLPNKVTPEPVTEEVPAESMEDLEVVDEGAPKTKEVVTPDPDEPTIDFNEFLKNKNTSPTEPKVEVAPKKDDKTVEPKDDKVVPLPTTTVTPKDDKARDYTGIDEKDVPHFKRMGNDAFNSFKPVYIENKKLKTDIAERDTKLTKLETDFKTLKDNGPQIPESYYDNPQGYLLDPEFQREVSTMTQAQQILQHWTNQYDAVAEGAKEVTMIDVDPRTGQLVETAKVPATRGIEAKLLAYVNHSQNQLQLRQVNIQSRMQTYQSRASEQVNSVKNLSGQFFTGFYKTPEDKAIYEPLIQEKLTILPPAFRSNPLARLTAESLVMNEVLAQLLNKAKEQQTTAAPTAVPVKTKAAVPNNRLNPTNGDLTGDAAPGKGGEVDISIDDFNRIKNGY